MSWLAMNRRASENTAAPSSVSNLSAYDKWLEDMGISAATGWRWRRDGLITTVNILGRVYISREVVEAFERRAAAGEFAKVHQTPRRKRGTT
jgi:hypothetical protein